MGDFYTNIFKIESIVPAFRPQVAQSSEECLLRPARSTLVWTDNPKSTAYTPSVKLKAPYYMVVAIHSCSGELQLPTGSSTKF